MPKMRNFTQNERAWLAISGWVPPMREFFSTNPFLGHVRLSPDPTESDWLTRRVMPSIGGDKIAAGTPEIAGGACLGVGGAVGRMSNAVSQIHGHGVRP